MLIHLAPGDGLPFYRQIVNQVKYLVAAGRLSPGEQLPPVRRLAEQLVINPNTVARAYRELESAGVITTRPGAGVYVSEGGSRLARAERKRLLVARIDALLAEAHHLDVDVDDVVEMLRRRSRQLD